MQLPDVNVLIHAHRADAPEHGRYAAWLRTLTASSAPFALSGTVLAGFLRVVTNARIFDPPTPMETAIAFCQRLVARPRAVLVTPGRRHWSIFVGLCGGISSPWWNPASHRERRGARLTRREEGAYWAYATDEQRRQAGCIAARMQRGLPPRAVRGPLVTDAYLAALAIEHGCELITTDGDFVRFPELGWRHPLAP